MKIKLITTLLFLIATTSYAKDTLGETERMNSKLPNLEYQPETSEAERLSRNTNSTSDFIKYKKCEEVNERYIVCDNIVYVRDSKAENELGHHINKVKETITKEPLKAIKSIAK